MLFIISLRNLIARSSLPSLSLSLTSYLPSSTSLSLPALLSLLHQSFSPAVVVLSSECAVDWLKHAFITKFNHIRPGVYGRFVDVLCKDLVTGAAGRGGRRSHEGEVRLSLSLSLLSPIPAHSPSCPRRPPPVAHTPPPALRRPIPARLAAPRLRGPPARVPRRARHQPGVRDARRRERRRRVCRAAEQCAVGRVRAQGRRARGGGGRVGEGREGGRRGACGRRRVDVVRFLHRLSAVSLTL